MVNRADIVLTRNAIKLPVEIKGQWSRDVWDAAVDQLDAKYTVDWQAEGRGVLHSALVSAAFRRGGCLPIRMDLNRRKPRKRCGACWRIACRTRGVSLIDIFVIDVSRRGEAK